MDVYLVRHAEAVDETRALRDPMRYLTSHGRAQAQALGERLRWHDCEPTHVWASPLVRAVQTAELVTAALGGVTPVEIAPELAPDAPARALIAALPAEGSVLLVGHEPSLSAIGALLVGGDLAALAKAEAVRICDGALRWRFRWDAPAPDTTP